MALEGAHEPSTQMGEQENHFDLPPLSILGDHRMTVGTQPRGILNSGRALVLSDAICLMLPALIIWTDVLPALLTTVVSLALFSLGDLYLPRLQAVVLDQVPSLLGRLLAAVGLASLLSIAWGPGVNLRSFGIVMAIGAVLMMAGRVLILEGVRMARRKGRARHRTLIIGSSALAERIAVTLTQSPRYGLDVVGYIDNNRSSGACLGELGYLGDVSHLREKVNLADADVIVITSGSFTTEQVSSQLRLANWNDTTIFVVPRYYQAAPQSDHPEMIGAVPVTRLGPKRLYSHQMTFKRVIDVVACSVALVFIWPLLALIAICIRIDSGPGILFRQERLGQDGKSFEMLKFRSMKPLDESKTTRQWESDYGDRVTRVGRILRKTSLDEMPQIFSILKGDMTIVGPRPEEPLFVDQFIEKEPEYIFRMRVPAGLTGLAQVNGLRGNTSISERADFDNFYIENWSLWLDIKIIIRTVSQVLLGRGN